jgi:hypothetical protein
MADSMYACFSVVIMVIYCHIFLSKTYLEGQKKAFYGEYKVEGAVTYELRGRCFCECLNAEICPSTRNLSL